MVKSTDGKALVKDAYGDRKGMDGRPMLHWVTISDANGRYIERQVYVDEETGIDYVSLGGFLLDRLKLEDEFGLRFDFYGKDQSWG